VTPVQNVIGVSPLSPVEQPWLLGSVGNLDLQGVMVEVHIFFFVSCLL
jgi:hypothetical protein